MVFNRFHPLLQLIDSLYFNRLNNEFDKFNQALQEAWVFSSVWCRGEEDVKHLKLWLLDLVQIGYQFPKLPERCAQWNNHVKLCATFHLLPPTSVVRIPYQCNPFHHLLVECGQMIISVLCLVLWTYRTAIVQEQIILLEVFNKLPWLTVLYNSFKTDTNINFVCGRLLNLNTGKLLPRAEVWRTSENVFSPHEAAANEAWHHWNIPLGNAALQKVIDSLPAMFN